MGRIFDYMFAVTAFAGIAILSAVLFATAGVEEVHAMGFGIMAAYGAFMVICTAAAIMNKLPRNRKYLVPGTALTLAGVLGLLILIWAIAR